MGRRPSIRWGGGDRVMGDGDMRGRLLGTDHHERSEYSPITRRPRHTVSLRLTRGESIAAGIANGVDAVVGRWLIDRITPGEGGWATALPDFPFCRALGFIGIGDAVAVADQILCEKKAVDRGLSAGGADAVGRIERIESGLGFRDVNTAIAVAVDATARTGRVDRTVGGDANRQAGWVPRGMERYTIRHPHGLSAFASPPMRAGK
jgi:hypothetical protein